MNVENPAALRYLMQDDIFLLSTDKAFAAANVSAVAVKETVTSEPETQLVVEQIAVETPSIQIPKLEPVVTPQAAVAPTTTPQTPQGSFNYLGGNKKQILILTHYANERHIAAEHLAALESILKRKDVAIDDVAIFNMYKSQLDMPALKAEFKPIKLLVLGAEALPTNMKLPFNQLRQGNGGSALYSFSFAEMMSSNDNKKAFWEQMKNF